LPTNTFNLERLRAGLKPFRLHWFSRVRSTNDHAAAMRKEDKLFAPAVVLTANQLAGRGRAGNTWWSLPGDKTLTVTFAMPIEEHLAAYQVPLVAGLAVRNAAAEIAGDPSIGLKWPNDLLHAGRKLAGLLCERVHRVDLIGLGLNINLDPSAAPEGLREKITSLMQIAGKTFDPTEALITIAQHLHRTLSRRNEQPFAALLQEYDRHHALVGRKVSVVGSNGEPATSGTCEGLDDQGRLLLRDGKQLHRVIAGHVMMH